MTTHTIQETETLTTMRCGSCSIIYAMPESKRQLCLRDGTEFYCPNGHCRVYTESELEKARRELQQERAAHDQTKATVRDLQATATKLEHRLKHGVCPCCRRTFQNLQNHMRTKHPEYGPPALNMSPRKRGRPAKGSSGGGR